MNVYLNDPSIIDEPMPLREVHAIRLMIYEETKDMSLAERVAYQKRKMQVAKEKYGINFVKLSDQ